MEEKKTIKISISTFFLMLSIIAICVMGFYIYKLNDKNTNSSFELNGTYEWTNPYGEGIICTFSNGTFTLESTWNYKGTYVISGNKVILKTTEMLDKNSNDSKYVPTSEQEDEEWTIEDNKLIRDIKQDDGSVTTQILIKK